MSYLNHCGHALKLFEAILIIAGVIHWREENYKGTISAVAEQEITVSAAGEPRVFSVTEATTITLDGQATKLARLPVGGPVEVVFDGKADPKKDTWKAVRISAMSLK